MPPTVLLEILGGIGLFLLGIVLLTDGLRALAGEGLRRGLARFTGSRFKAFLSGLAATAVIQSASATILMTMGLGAAGLLTMTQSLAIMVGANVGTTGTAWLVATLGLRFSIGQVAFVFVALGAFVRLLLRGGWAASGQAVAGFGLLFVGIDLLRAGMEGLAPTIATIGAGESGWLGAAALVLVGALTTVVVQSSSVTVAATLTAVFTGGLSLTDGALLVVGQNLGTTSTSILGGLGAGTQGRRVAVAHVGINLGTGLTMFLLFRPLLWASSGFSDLLGTGDTIALAAFHTGFNLVGAAIALPLLGPIQRGTERIVHERGPPLARNLDPLVARVPGVGVEAVRRAIAEVAAAGLGVARSRLEHGRLVPGTERRQEAVERGLLRCQDFLAGLHTTPDSPEHDLHLRTVHALDHLERIVEAGRDPTLRQAGVTALRNAPAGVRFRDALDQADRWVSGDLDTPAEEALAALEGIPAARKRHRSEAMARAAAGEQEFSVALAELDALNWMRDLAHPLARLIHYLGGPGREADADPSMA